MAHRFQFFVDSRLEVGVVATLSRDDLHHLATIRAVAGDLVDVVDAGRQRFEAELLEGLASAVVLRASTRVADEVFVHVYVGSLTSGQRWDSLVDACVQAGADAITPLVQNPRERDAAAKRIERGARIARAAAQQAKRSAIPKVFEPLSYRDLPREPAGIVLDLATTNPLVSVDVAGLADSSVRVAAGTSAEKVGAGSGAGPGAGAGSGAEPGAGAGSGAGPGAGAGAGTGSGSGSGAHANAGGGTRRVPVVVGGAEGLPDGLVADLVSHGWQAATLGPNVLRAGLAAAVATSFVRQLADR